MVMKPAFPLMKIPPSTVLKIGASLKYLIDNFPPWTSRGLANKGSIPKPVNQYLWWLPLVVGAGVGRGIHNDHLKYIFSIRSHVYFAAQHVKICFLSREHRTVVSLSSLFFFFTFALVMGKITVKDTFFFFCPKVWEDQF